MVDRHLSTSAGDRTNRTPNAPARAGTVAGVIDVAIRFRRQNRQTAIDGTVGPHQFGWVARSKAGHGIAIDGDWEGEPVALEVHERKIGTAVAVVAGTIGAAPVHLDVSRHLRLGLDVSGTIGADTIALRLDRPVGARRRVVHRQPGPDVAMLLVWQNLGGNLTGQVARPIDAVAATLVGLTSGETTGR